MCQFFDGLRRGVFGIGRLCWWVPGAMVAFCLGAGPELFLGVVFVTRV